jgi:hypothetical protein
MSSPESQQRGFRVERIEHLTQTAGYAFQELTEYLELANKIRIVASSALPFFAYG